MTNFKEPTFPLPSKYIEAFGELQMYWPGPKGHFLICVYEKGIFAWRDQKFDTEPKWARYTFEQHTYIKEQPCQI